MCRSANRARAVGTAALFAAAAVLASAARAEVSGSAAIVSDYRFRGVSLSAGDPAAQANVNYDDPAGWYSGAFLANTRLGAQPRAMVQWLPYAGFAKRLTSSASLDLGAAYSGFTDGNQLGYFEANAGVASGDFHLGLHYSPNYFRGDARTLYGEIDASRSLATNLRVFAHLGDLELLSTPPGEHDPVRRQLDVRAGISTRWSRATFSLSWVSVDHVASVYPVQSYEGSLNAARKVWMAQISISF